MDETTDLDARIVDEAPPADAIRASSVPAGEDIVVFDDGPMDRLSSGQPVAMAEECVSWGYCIWRGDDGECIFMMSCHTTLHDFEFNHCNESCGWGELD